MSQDKIQTQPHHQKSMIQLSLQERLQAFETLQEIEKTRESH